MSLRPPASLPVTLREFTRWCRETTTLGETAVAALETVTLPAGLLGAPFANGDSIGFLDVTANGAGSSLAGMSGISNVLPITITNVSANTLTLTALDGTVLPEYQFRLPSNLALSQYERATFRYSADLEKWVPV